MKTSKILLAAALAAAASVAVGGQEKTIESTQTVQATQPIQVAQAQTRKGKKTGKKKAGVCSGLYVGQKVPCTNSTGASGEFKILKINTTTGKATAQAPDGTILPPLVCSAFKALIDTDGDACREF